MSITIPNTYQFRCDTCGMLSDPVDLRGETWPRGWLSVTTNRSSAALHFCGKPCLITWVNRRTYADSPIEAPFR